LLLSLSFLLEENCDLKSLLGGEKTREGRTAFVALATGGGRPAALQAAAIRKRKRKGNFSISDVTECQLASTGKQQGEKGRRDLVREFGAGRRNCPFLSWEREGQGVGPIYSVPQKSWPIRLFKKKEKGARRRPIRRVRTAGERRGKRGGARGEA